MESPSPSPSLMETLMTNAQYIPTDNKPSKCEEKCQLEQAALISCVNSIRDASVLPQYDHDSDKASQSNSTDVKDSSCLRPVVASWTDCCTKVNNLQDE